MAEFKGVVENITSKDVNTKFGTKKVYTVRAGGSNINVGFKFPTCAVGDTIVCDAESTPYGLQTKDISVTSKASSAPSTFVPSATASFPTSKSATTYAGAKVFPVPALHGDRSIIRQNVLTRAVELYIASKAGKAFALDEDMTDICILFARKLEAYATGDLDLAEAEAEMAAEVDAANAPAKLVA
jgi:hypothetical protein